MKRYYEANIILSKIFEVDEEEIREKCEVPDNVEITDDMYNEWIEELINNYTKSKDIDFDIVDIVLGKVDL